MTIFIKCLLTYLHKTKPAVQSYNIQSSKESPPPQRQKVVIPCKESQTKTCTDIKPMSKFSPSQWPAEVVHGHLCHCNKYHL